MGPSEREVDRAREGQLRRQAAQLLCALPEETSEARRVLRYALQLLDEWIESGPEDGPADDRPDGEKVITFSRFRTITGLAAVVGFAVVACWTICLRHPTFVGLKASDALHEIGVHAQLGAAINPVQRDTCHSDDLPGVVNGYAPEPGFVIVPRRLTDPDDSAPRGLNRVA